MWGRPRPLQKSPCTPLTSGVSCRSSTLQRPLNAWPQLSAGLRKPHASERSGSKFKHLRRYHCDIKTLKYESYWDDGDQLKTVTEGLDFSPWSLPDVSQTAGRVDWVFTVVMQRSGAYLLFRNSSTDTLRVISANFTALKLSQIWREILLFFLLFTASSARQERPHWSHRGGQRLISVWGRQMELCKSRLFTL